MIERLAVRGLWQGALCGAGLAATLSLAMSLTWGRTEDSLLAEAGFVLGAAASIAVIGAFLGGLVGLGLGLVGGAVLLRVHRALPRWAAISVTTCSAGLALVVVVELIVRDGIGLFGWSTMILAIATWPMVRAVRRELDRARPTEVPDADLGR